ncbi:CHAP domain-containing protein [Streptomyces sp. NBC_01381]|uniref:CHAP domain-containing protein n=1 Tax=Streptomyces sp. NBC_01381 TaxID=2903845 RepID=UPI0022588127|nr:CHAP domain-containing protein [Streptomyces sp. NBC_01381]MCX4672249.1 CHAP domain-containing protein [Streptomyces sp. NBC_01381]
MSSSTNRTTDSSTDGVMAGSALDSTFRSRKAPAYRRPAVVLLATAVAGVVAAGSLTATASAAPSPLRMNIVKTATIEKDNPKHNREKGNNCNFYSGYWKPSGDNICSTSTGGVKWRSNNWCADFVRYVWKNSGAKTKHTDPWAGSFYRAAKAGTGKWHKRGSYVPKAGDAVLYDWDGGTPSLGTNGWDVDHVGVVIQYRKSGKKLTTIEGNTTKTSSGSGKEGVFKRTRYNTERGDVVGYVSPERR